MSKTLLKLIAVSQENYQTLKQLGCAGDSFNDVLTKLLKVKEKESERLTRPSTSINDNQPLNPSRNDCYNG
jgi:predicted CopG family antitoxin